MDIVISGTKLLIVEGKDDKNFFSALNRHLDLTEIQIMDIGGKTLLADNLQGLVRAPGFNRVVSVGVIRDADKNADGAFKSVCFALEGAHLGVPARPLLPAGGRPIVMAMIITEMLEDLCLRSVADDPAVACIEDYFQCIDKNLDRGPNNLSKAKVQAFLASRKRPVASVGLAAKKGYWPWGSPAFDEVKQFLTML